MPDRSNVTRESLEAALLGIPTSPLASVRYYGFGMGLPGGQPIDSEWGDASDLGADDAEHHFPAMGVELTFNDASAATVCWGDAFGHFGLEIVQEPAASVFRNSPASGDVTGHRWWAPLVGTILSAELHWATGFADGAEPAPLVLELSSGGFTLWLSASEYADDGTTLLGMDGVTVSPRLDAPMASVTT